MRSISDPRDSGAPRYWLWLVFGVPAAIALLFIAESFIVFPQAIRPWFPVWIGGTALMNLALCFALYAWVRQTETLSPGWSWSLVAAGAVVAALASAAFNYWLLVHYQRALPRFTVNYHRGIGINLINDLWPFGFFAAAQKLLRAAEHTRLSEAHLANVRSAAARARLTALRHQINPHFLFNSLNALSGLIIGRQDRKAKAMMERLTEFFRASLQEFEQGMTSLARELAMLEAYLSIEKARFGKRLAVSVECREELGTVQLPAFLLQPIVENAIKHAVAPSVAPVALSIMAVEEQGRLTVTVADDGKAGTVAAGLGLGLHNVRERLRLLYGDRASLEMRATAEGFSASVTLPIEHRAP